jgi:hypothetical protein
MSATTPPVPPQAYDRLQFLLAQTGAPAWNGIDYVEIASSSQTLLRVHFLTTAPVAPASGSPPLTVTISGGETIPTVAVLPIDPASAWSVDPDGRPLLTVGVGAPGDYSAYTLTIGGATALDPYFASAQFSFKATCTSEYDCAPAAPSGPADGGEPVAINYLVKDFSIPVLGRALGGGRRHGGDGGAECARR